MIRRALLPAFVWLTACTSGGSGESGQPIGAAGDSGAPPGPELPNPTGDCVAETNGARAGYHTPDAGDVWLPDCENGLRREYWRVFARSETSAYVIPRPDGAAELRTGPCMASEHALRPIVERYGLCEPAETPEAVDRVNDMTPEDALRLTRYLHTQLAFVGIEGAPGGGIYPFPVPTDVLDACDLTSARSAALEEVCRLERQYVESGVDVGRDYSSVLGELPPLLDQLYGIDEECPSGETRRRVCIACGVVGGCGQQETRCTRPCSTDGECVGVTAGSLCMMQVCGPVTFCI